jgi:hypothetical protein
MSTGKKSATEQSFASRREKWAERNAGAVPDAIYCTNIGQVKIEPFRSDELCHMNSMYKLTDVIAEAAKR